MATSKKTKVSATASAKISKSALTRSVKRAPRKKSGVGTKITPPAESMEAVSPVLAQSVPVQTTAIAKPMTMALALRPKPMITLLGIAAFAMAMGVGLWNTGQLVGQETTIETIAHNEDGQVAGVTVDRQSGTVSIIVDSGTQKQTFALGIDQPMSVYNVLRIANATTLLHTQTQVSPQGTTLAGVADVLASPNAVWHVDVDGQPSDNLDTSMVHAGSVLVLSLVTS